jgi:DNA relaxase NicK
MLLHAALAGKGCHVARLCWLLHISSFFSAVMEVNDVLDVA